MSDDATMTFYQNPKIDYLFGYLDGNEVPTKSDDFKMLKGKTFVEIGGSEILEYAYKKKPTKKNVRKFEAFIAELAKKAFQNEIIRQPFNVEVLIFISTTLKRYKTVDLDNLTKTIFDGLKGVAFEDDVQVSNLYCHKYVHENKRNNLFIGITKLTQDKTGFGGDIELFSDSPW